MTKSWQFLLFRTRTEPRGFQESIADTSSSVVTCLGSVQSANKKISEGNIANDKCITVLSLMFQEVFLSNFRIAFPSPALVMTSIKQQTKMCRAGKWRDNSSQVFLLKSWEFSKHDVGILSIWPSPYTPIESFHLCTVYMMCQLWHHNLGQTGTRLCHQKEVLMSKWWFLHCLFPK